MLHVLFSHLSSGDSGECPDSRISIQLLIVILHNYTCNLTFSATSKMPKRTASDALLNGLADQPFNKMPATGIRRETYSVDEMGEFEDAWEDEIESDQEVVDVDEERDDGGCASFTCEYNLHAIIAFRNGC